MTYEFIEWWTALILGQNADAFLGTQGDPWDTQWDMFSATVGAVLGQCFYWVRKWNARGKGSIQPTLTRQARGQAAKGRPARDVAFGSIALVGAIPVMSVLHLIADIQASGAF